MALLFYLRKLLVVIFMELSKSTIGAEELIYFVCQNILGREKEKGRIEQKR
jgi:hypothetical protein